MPHELFFDFFSLTKAALFREIPEILGQASPALIPLDWQADGLLAPDYTSPYAEHFNIGL